MRIVECSILILASSIILASAVSAAPELTTLSERTDFRQTGRYEEVERLCAAFAAAYPKNVRSVRFGTTPEGQTMKGFDPSFQTLDGYIRDITACIWEGRQVVEAVRTHRRLTAGASQGVTAPKEKRCSPSAVRRG